MIVVPPEKKHHPLPAYFGPGRHWVCRKCGFSANHYALEHNLPCGRCTTRKWPPRRRHYVLRSNRPRECVEYNVQLLIDLQTR